MFEKLRNNYLSLLVGLSLPIILIIVFLILNLPFFKPNPPLYSVLFAVVDSSNASPSLQTNFIVKNNKIIAQYSKAKNNYWGIKKLYFFDAKKQTVQEIPLDLKNANTTNMQEQIVYSAEPNKIDTSLDSSDGYRLYVDNDNLTTGLLSEVLLGNYKKNVICLKKQSICIKLLDTGNQYMNSNNVQFIGWVKP